MQTTSKGGFWADNRLTFKGILIGILIILMLIPTLYIMNLISERSQRKQEITRDINSKWASEQTFTGPVLVIPYTDGDPSLGHPKKYAYFLPEQLTVHSELEPQVREKSIYRVIVYRSNMDVEGNFAALNADPIANSTNLLLQEAQLCVGVSDFMGIEDQLIADWNGQKLTLNAGMPDNDVIKRGLSVPISLTAEDFTKVHHFKLKLQLRGSEKMNFVPIGKSTVVTMHSTWQHPSFEGKFVPVNKPGVSTAGFNATWKVQHLNRNYPQSWKEGKYNLEESKFWVKLLQPVDSYAQTMRSAKYAILFISLTFALYFFVEILQKRSVHPLQYILVGIALCIFYTLLLSISEYLEFGIAYAIAAGATIALITLYSRGLFNKWNTALLLGALLAMLYGFIFILIQLEDNALLFGSIGLFILLAIIMYCSRKIQWYAKPTLPTSATGIPSISA